MSQHTQDALFLIDAGEEFSIEPVSVGAMDGGFYAADTGPGISESDREEIFDPG